MMGSFQQPILVSTARARDFEAVLFEDETTAFDMRAALLKMQKQYLIEMEDSVVVIKSQNGAIRLDQAVNLTAVGAVGGGLWAC